MIVNRLAKFDPLSCSIYYSSITNILRQFEPLRKISGSYIILINEAIEVLMFWQFNLLVDCLWSREEQLVAEL